MYSLKNFSLSFLLFYLFQVLHEEVLTAEREWCAALKSTVQQIAKKENLELLTYLSNTITSEFGFQKYYLLFSPLAGSCWSKQSNTAEAAAFQFEASKFWSFQLCDVLVSWKSFLSATQKFHLLKGEVWDVKGGLTSHICAKPQKLATRSANLCLNSFGLVQQSFFTVPSQWLSPGRFPSPFSTPLPWISHMQFRSIGEAVSGLSLQTVLDYQMTKGLNSQIACNLETSFSTEVKACSFPLKKKKVTVIKSVSGFVKKNIIAILY